MKPCGIFVMHIAACNFHLYVPHFCLCVCVCLCMLSGKIQQYLHVVPDGNSWHYQLANIAGGHLKGINLLGGGFFFYKLFLGNRDCCLILE